MLVETTCADGRAELVGDAAAWTAATADESACLRYILSLSVRYAHREHAYISRNALPDGDCPRRSAALAKIATEIRFVVALPAGELAKIAVRVADSDTTGTLIEAGTCFATEGRGAGFYAVFTARMQLATQTAVTQFAY